MKERHEQLLPGAAGSGLFLARESPRPLASLLGLTPETVRRSMLPPGSAVYLTALDYCPAIEDAAGCDFDPDAWLSVLLCQYPREEHLAALATLNHIAQDHDRAAEYQRDFLSRASPEMAAAIRAALRGETAAAAGEPRIFLARHAILRAIRLVSHLSPMDASELAAAQQRTGRLPRSFDPLACATMLVHAIAVGLGAHTVRNDGDQMLGGVPEPLAMEMICGGAFARQGNPGNMLARTLLLYREYGALVTKPLRAAPIDLAEQALGMPLLRAVAIGFSYYAQTGSQTSNRGASVHPLTPPAHVEAAAPGALARFLERFAGTVDELAVAARASRLDWQNLYLQERPLLLVDDGVLVLDESFLLERFTTGLFFLVLEHERALGGDKRADQWRAAYGQMHEMLVEDYLREWAPAALGGVRTTFDEDDLKAAYDPANKGGGRVDFGIDYGSSVLLADAVSGQLSVPTRERGDPEALLKDLDRMVVGKARQLAGSFEMVTRDPQPLGAPVSRPAVAVNTIVVPGGQFPVMRVTSRVLADLFVQDSQVSAMLADPRCLGLRVLDLRDLEQAAAIRPHDGRTLPELIAGWRDDPAWHDGSLSDWLLANVHVTTGGDNRPPLLARPLHEVFEAMELLLLTETERQDGHLGAVDGSAPAGAS